jgi:hypothetical protein
MKLRSPRHACSRFSQRWPSYLRDQRRLCGIGVVAEPTLVAALNELKEFKNGAASSALGSASCVCLL